MCVPFTTTLLIAAIILHSDTSLLANSRIPDLKADAFGHEYNDLFNNTIVYTQVGWLQLFYRFSGESPAQPPPGWIRLKTKPDDMWDTDRILFQLNGSGDVILSQGDPFFAITLEQARRIANSEQATAIAVREETSHKPKLVVTLKLSHDQRRLIGQLADHGREWKPMDKPWEIGGATALVVDLQPAAQARLEQVKSLLLKEIERREQSKDPFLLIDTRPEDPRNWSGYGGIEPYYPGREWYKPEGPPKFVREMGVVPDDKALSLGQMAAVVTGEQLQSMVVFAPDGSPLTDPDRVEEQLREESCRVFVVWLGESESRSERFEQLKALAFRTRGQFVVLPPVDGTAAKLP